MSRLFLSRTIERSHRRSQEGTQSLRWQLELR
jgi:hypothetical protein